MIPAMSVLCKPLMVAAQLSQFQVLTICVINRGMLTFRRDHADHYGRGGGGALQQYGGQHPDHEARHRVTQDDAAGEHLTRSFAWKQRGYQNVQESEERYMAGISV